MFAMGDSLLTLARYNCYSRQMIQKTLVFLLLFIVFTTVSAQKDRPTLDAVYIEKSVSKVSETLLVGKFEVNNWLYNQFLSDLSKNRKKEDLKIASVDSANWLKPPVYIAPFAKFYHRDKKYDDFPVVNISYEGAVLFCEWLTEKYNSFPERKYKNVKIRLPNEEEWVKAAKGKNAVAVYPTGAGLKNKSGIQMANYKRTDLAAPSDPNMPDPGDILMLAPVKSYWPCSFGTYNMAGNAAEMISTKGITKGGGFIDTEVALPLDAKGVMDAPASHIGFRYFVELLP